MSMSATAVNADNEVVAPTGTEWCEFDLDASDAAGEGVPNPDFNPDSQVQCANSNAQEAAQALGLTGGSECCAFDMPVDEVAERVHTYLIKASGNTHIDEYMRHVAAGLSRFIGLARARGATRIYMA